MEQDELTKLRHEIEVMRTNTGRLSMLVMELLHYLDQRFTRETPKPSLDLLVARSPLRDEEILRLVRLLMDSVPEAAAHEALAALKAPA